MQPVTQLQVLPLYGTYRALITWQLDPTISGKSVRIQKSPDGLTDWEEIGDVAQTETSFEDTNLLQAGYIHENYYRLQVHDLESAFEPTSPVGTFGTLSRRDFAFAKAMMDKEYKILKSFNPVQWRRLKVWAPTCPDCTDPDTGQSTDTSQCTTCWSTKKEGGYAAPVNTYMRIMTTGPKVQTDEPSGAGTYTPTLLKARMLAYPPLSKNDLLITPGSDERYLVERLDVSYYAGKAPTIAVVDLRQLSQGDIRFRLPTV